MFLRFPRNLLLAFLALLPLLGVHSPAAAGDRVIIAGGVGGLAAAHQATAALYRDLGGLADDVGGGVARVGDGGVHVVQRADVAGVEELDDVAVFVVAVRGVGALAGAALAFVPQLLGAGELGEAGGCTVVAEKISYSSKMSDCRN